DYYYKKYKIGPVDALTRTMVRVRGSYALEVMFKDYPQEIYVARKDSPMIIGISEGESYIASDVPALLNYCRSVYYIDNLELARVLPGEIHFFDLNGDEIPKEATEITFSVEAAEKGGYEHFMMKEIHEQPRVIADTLHSAVQDGRIDLGIPEETLKNISQIYIAACGSAYHVGVISQYVLEELTNLPVRTELASEFRYRKTNLDPDALVVVISQSGETADSLAALRQAKTKGLKTLAIVNVVGSSIAREADYVFYTKAGPEIAVATTKAYSAQLVAMYLFALKIGEVRETIEDMAKYLQELESLPGKVERLLDDKERLQWFASKLSNTNSIFYIGRGLDYAICLEGSLKLKEISYIHSEAYAAGELKHGTISLVEKGTMVISSLTQPDLYEKTVSNMVEVKSRGAALVAIASYGYYSIEDCADFVVYIPKTLPVFAASLAVIPMQLLAYYAAVARGEDVDKPRNLAKSVTVE
ncbi:MAG: glutamine--fructose-6-phosphate transaminase (isomerizing), partial [Clostridia bacterium]|nr:glutamine--fructose-6-phosphate transaminase (isomerizing) [Clostridia bacterium]